MFTVIGTVVFLFSVALPMISIQFIATFSIRLLDVYSWVGRGPSLPEDNSQWAQAFSAVGIGLLLVAILYPITVVVGFLSLAISPKGSVVAGVLGIACWLCSVIATLELKSIVSQLLGVFGADLIQIGYGVYVGILGSVVLLVSYFVAARETRTVVSTRADVDMYR